jgi:hypothetical protein
LRPPPFGSSTALALAPPLDERAIAVGELTPDLRKRIRFGITTG